MEEVLIVLLQLILEIAASGGLDFLTFFVGRKEPQPSEGCAWCFLMAALGGGIAALVNVFHPRVFLPQPWMRITMLLVAPVLSGFASKKIAELRARSTVSNASNQHFWRTFCFVLALELVRFCWASRT